MHDTTPEAVIAAIAAGSAAVVPRSGSGHDLVHAVRIVASGGFYLPLDSMGIFAELAEARSHGPCEGRSPGARGRFSPGESQVLPLLMEGLSNKLIAQRLEIEESAVKARLRSIFGKLGVANRAQSVKALIDSSNGR